MKSKIIVLAAASLWLACGSAFANSSALDDEDQMQPFYQDKDMKQMKTGGEFEAVVKALTPEKMTRMTNDCHEDANGKRVHTDFCAALDRASGAKGGQPDTGSHNDTNKNSN